MELYLKDMPDDVFRELSARAKMAGRSIDDQAIQFLRVALEQPATGFAEDAKRALALASEEAKRMNHSYVGTEHILLGLVREGECVAAKVLAKLGVELTKLRSAVEFIIGRGRRTVTEEGALTPRAKRVIELAKDEARWLGDTEVSSWHLLLGIMREGEGVACGALEVLGVTLTFEKVFASR